MRFGRDREAEWREACGKARDTQHAQRVFDEGGRDVAQDARLEVATAAVRIDDAAAIAVVDGLRHRVDREVTSRQVFLERHVGGEARGEAVVAGTGLALRAGKRVLVAGLRMQEDGKVLADGSVTEREQVVGLCADDHVVAFGEGSSEQGVSHRATDQVGFHSRIVAEFASGRRCRSRNPNPIPTPGKADTGVGIGFGSRPGVTRLSESSGDRAMTKTGLHPMPDDSHGACRPTHSRTMATASWDGRNAPHRCRFSQHLSRANCGDRSQ